MASESSPQFRSIKAHVSEPSHRLPEEIIEEILSRLPVKSLLRFRCVWKPWRDLIGSKSFVKKHLANSTENPNFANHKIILDSMIPWRRLKQCSLTSMLNDPFTVQFKSFSLKNIRRDWIRIVGCCDGLVCLLLNRKHFMLWNPSTRKTKKLPHIDGRIIERGYISSYGFGYDDLSGDYMVFGIAAIFGSGVRYETICKVYSLETNSWKIVEVENVSRFTRWGKFASGKMHWDKRGGIISYFDLRSKVFDVIKPPITNGVFCKSVGVFGGRACLLCDDRVGNFDIWVIKEYGVNASWERAVKIPYLRTTLVCLEDELACFVNMK